MNLTEGKKSAFHLPEKRFVLPRTFVLQPGLTMLLGQLGRLDVLEVSGLTNCVVRQCGDTVVFALQLNGLSQQVISSRKGLVYI